MNLAINESKTKYLITTRHTVGTQSSTKSIGSYTFEQVDEFKYLQAVKINTINNAHKEIQLRISNTILSVFCNGQDAQLQTIV